MQQPMYNIQMMRVEPHKEYHSINIVRCSGMDRGEDKGKQQETKGWVCKAVEKEAEFDLKQAKETFIEGIKNFVEASTLGNQEKSSRNNEVQDVDPSLLDAFLKTCMKLLMDKKAVEGLQEIIDNFMGKIKIPL